MQLKSILNRIQVHHGFVYGSIRLVEKANDRGQQARQRLLVLAA